MLERTFGYIGDKEIKAYTLKNDYIECEIITYGGAIRTLYFNDINGKKQDLVLGYNTIEDYLSNSGCVGSLIGRCGNRIEKGQFVLNGVKYQIPAINNGNALHGGVKGFDKRVWDSEVDGEKLVLTYFSKDMEEGFPGNLTTRVTYSLIKNTLKIEYSAKCDKDTVVNLTNHTYFNLAGENSGSVFDTEIYINAEQITPVDKYLIPHNEFMEVKDTPFDFSTSKKIGKDFYVDNEILKNCGGYDNNFVINGNGYRLCATAFSEKTGIKMSVFSDQKGMQFYTANFLDTKSGKSRPYGKYDGFCFETQNFPNAINCDNYPSPVLRKGEEYKTTTEFVFSEVKR